LKPQYQTVFKVFKVLRVAMVFKDGKVLRDGKVLPKPVFKVSRDLPQQTDFKDLRGLVSKERKDPKVFLLHPATSDSWKFTTR
jgi:hypothetical protein